jgi:2-keto-4-pentenoate hydratase
MTTADPAREHAIAATLLEAQAARRALAPFTDADAALDQAAAYRIARRILDARCARGEVPVGRKLGFTNRTIWPEYGVYEPIWAHVYDRTVTFCERPSATASMARFIEPRIEPEIILHFRAAPPATRDPRALLECIDWIAHGYEIVDSPFPAWRFRVADTIAAFGLHAALYVGPPAPVAQLARSADALAEALAAFTIELACDGAVRARGTGANVLDSPLAATAHVIAVLATQPEFAPIAAGEIVTTGTLTAALPIRARETWTTRLAGLDLPGFALALGE